ncbi:hypothetical protein ACFL13_00260 [Patescibacteria group bacterium]
MKKYWGHVSVLLGIVAYISTLVIVSSGQLATNLITLRWAWFSIVASLSVTFYYNVAPSQWDAFDKEYSVPAKYTGNPKLKRFLVAGVVGESISCLAALLGFFLSYFIPLGSWVYLIAIVQGFSLFAVCVLFYDFAVEKLVEYMGSRA